MSTNSRIGIQVDGGIVSAYHHWDGYPQWLGVTLKQQYNTESKVKELIDGGDMSSCYSDSEYDDEKKTFVKRDPRPEYYSARGEDAPPKLAESITEYLEQADNCCGEYAYLFCGGEWFCYDTDRYGKKFAQLVDIPEEYPEDV
tara:strand:- start:339 stop:767 length:429 start_codon:yes stop_codon:yes gene_type:complete